MSWQETGNSTADSALTLTHAAVAARRHFVTDFSVSFRGATSGNDIRCEIRDEDDTVLWDAYVDATRGLVIDEHFSEPIELDTNKGVKVVIAAAGTSTISTANVSGYTKP